MHEPNINNIIKDEDNKITYNIKAYRRLAREEMVQAVQFYYRQKKTKKKLKPGTTITIITIIGFNE